MRRGLPLILLALLFVGALVVELGSHSRPPNETAEPTVSDSAVDGTSAEKPAPAADHGPQSAASPRIERTASPAKSSPPALPPLPEKAVAAHVAHAVPAERPPPPPRNLTVPPTPHARGGGVGAKAAAGQFSGQAQVAGPTSLLVGSVMVELFGIRSPDPQARCGTYHCVNVAKAALKGRLQRNATVYCRKAAGGGLASSAICLDAQGADLGGYLVGEGLARADWQQSNDYVGAERIARDLHRGLWQR